MSTIYQSLNFERQVIRLLRLHPSESFDEIIQCSLFHAYLDDVPEYEALSYVWGPPNVTQHVLVDEKPFKITENLESALRYLRHASVDRILWVDALCINQTNIAERNHQVTLMKEIYSRCVRDLAWLGPTPGSSRTGSGEGGNQEDKNRASNELLEQLQAGIEVFRKICRHDSETLDDMLHRWKGHGERRLLMRDDQDKTPQWVLSASDQAGLEYLFRYAPLWSRIWVMQELSCADRVLLVAGTETLDWDDIASFLADDNKPYADAFHVTGGHYRLSRAVVSVFGVVQTIQQQRRIMKDVKEGRYESKLIDVLARFQYADAGDQRDVIYGLLGLVSELHPIKVDYAKPARELFADVTRFFIDGNANLDIICQNPWDAPEEVNKDEAEVLPSWVAGFTNVGRFAIFEDRLESLLFAQRGIFSAGTSTCVVPCNVSEDGLILSVRGVILDRLGPVLHVDPQGPIQNKPRKWMRLYFHEDLLASGSVYQPTGEPLFRAFWRALVMDCKSYPMCRLTPDDVEADEKMFRTLVQNDASEFNIFDLASGNTLWRMLWNWRFTMSNTGLLLMVSNNAQENDVLAILDGGKVPCLLRPFHHKNELRYRVIHSVYIHGYMDGQVETEVKQGKLQKQDILLA